MERLGVGFALHPDLEYLERTRDIIERDADYFEINPETLWRPGDAGLERNDFHSLFRELRERSGKPFVAHGLGFSLGTPLEEPGEAARADAWLRRLREDHAGFRFAWLSEHLGWQTADGREMILPLPLPFTEEARAAAAARLRLLRAAAEPVLFENGADLFLLGDPDAEPDFLNALCRTSGCGLLLDLHNVHARCLNLGRDPADYVDRLDLETVVQIHVSGGGWSEPEWLPSRRVFRLDSHDGPVPEEVWRLLERVLPRCPNLRGVVVERLNGTFGAADVPALAAEVRRARELFRC